VVEQPVDVRGHPRVADEPGLGRAVPPAAEVVVEQDHQGVPFEAAVGEGAMTDSWFAVDVAGT